MSLVLAGVHRDRSRAERGRGGGVGSWDVIPNSKQHQCDRLQTQPGYALKTLSTVHGYRRPQPGTLLLKPPQSCSLSARQRLKKESKQEKYKLNPDGEKSQTQHHFSFLLQITKQWPPPLSQIHYTQAI